MTLWQRTTVADPAVARLADDHYSRKTPGARCSSARQGSASFCTFPAQNGPSGLGRAGPGGGAFAPTSTPAGGIAACSGMSRRI